MKRSLLLLGLLSLLVACVPRTGVLGRYYTLVVQNKCFGNYSTVYVYMDGAQLLGAVSSGETRTFISIPEGSREFKAVPSTGKGDPYFVAYRMDADKTWVLCGR
ncbi:hypothetical protein Mterra_00330 [Calidithermus terrae]|uniref:Uncharacterized protein n=1 Tax=Calidithermus terrae TaxID=1408545 RepID=A0A399F426_9DEIN|nr:hypothetical protein [Calidithermus terrae]RIH90535.1 hypothetical protein Mterra_00330 [Calidithermus terrae]